MSTIKPKLPESLLTPPITDDAPSTPPIPVTPLRPPAPPRFDPAARNAKRGAPMLRALRPRRRT